MIASIHPNTTKIIVMADEFKADLLYKQRTDTDLEVLSSVVD